MRPSDKYRQDGGRTRLALVALFLLGYVAVLLATSVPKAMVPPALADVTWGTLASLGIVGLTRVMTRHDRSRAAARTMRVSGKQFLGGIVLGLALDALVLIAISITVGRLRLSPTPAPTFAASVLTILGFVALASMEELGFRGYPLRTLVDLFDERIGVLVVSILFAASHFLFGWPWQAILLGVLPSGVLFGVAAVVSGGLAMPIGLHAALNLAQWIAGEKATPGFFTMEFGLGSAVQSAAFASFIGAIILVLVATALWRWYPRAERTY